MAAPGGLPFIPRLPPIEIPGARGRPLSPLPNSPLTPPSLSPPSSLRKAFSVDSFANYQRSEASLGLRARSSRVFIGADGQGPASPRSGTRHTAASSASTSSWKERDRVLGMSERPSSFFNVGDTLQEEDAEHSAPENEDSDGVSAAEQRARPPKGKLRIPTRSNTGPKARRAVAARGESSSRDHSPVRGHVGPSPPAIGDPVVVHENATNNASASDHDICIAVVGNLGCGKSTVIRKGLKGYSLSRPCEVTFATDTAVDGSFKFMRREGRIPHSHGSPEQKLCVMEVDMDTFRFDKGSPVDVAWPKGAPRVDAVLVCYDAADEESFRQVPALLEGYSERKLPTMVLACRSDADRKVEPREAAAVLERFDAGLVEVTAKTDAGKEKIRSSFNWLLKAILRERRLRGGLNSYGQYRNPASPSVLFEPMPWENGRSEATTPTPSTWAARGAPSLSLDIPDTPQTSRTARPVSTVTTSTARVRSMVNMAAESEARGREWERDRTHSHTGAPRSEQTDPSAMTLSESKPAAAVLGPSMVTRDLVPPRWQTVDNLLHKLLFAGIAGDNDAFVWRFLLIYRCFTGPRNLLLAMQKAMKSLDEEKPGPNIFANFAQMRICHILEMWIKEYPWDFVVSGATTALGAVVRTIMTKTYLLHYASEFLPLLEVIPSLVDRDAIWAVKAVDPVGDSPEDRYDPSDTDDDFGTTTTDSPVLAGGSSYSVVTDLVDSPVSTKSSVGLSSASQSASHSTRSLTSRERKQSVMSSRAPSLPSITSPTSSMSQESEASHRQVIRELLKVSHDLSLLDPQKVAEELTRVQKALFLDIKPRHWVHYALRFSKKDVIADPVSKFSQFTGHLSQWVVSVILCHDKAKARAKQIERFVDIAERLRNLHNYSALRCVVAGINFTTFEGDVTMDIFTRRAPEKYKMLRSYNIIFSNLRAHSAYRQALRTVKGACIPDIDVHASDLLKAHEGNIDTDPSDRTKIHWAKWDMIAKFVQQLVRYGERCIASGTYNFDPEPQVSHLWRDTLVMDIETQRTRMVPPPDLSGQEDHAPHGHHHSRERTHQTRDALKKLAFWS